jgi:D-tyrosyl-tRNA(Tyr) deacylase
MKVLLQRVRRATVRVGETSVAQIGPGLLVFVGVENGDAERDADYLADKTTELRIFPDEASRMNRSVAEASGEILVVSQFTLAASTRHGRRPSFSSAAPPELGEALYRRFAERLRQRGLKVGCGVFGAMMEVELTNDGPVTILLDPPPWSDPP